MTADQRLLPPGIADDRSRALLDIIGRLGAIDRSVLLVQRFDSVPASALYALAWQFSVTGLAGWDLTTSDAQRRELLKRAIALHRRKGTPSAVLDALAAVGWPDAAIEEPFGAARYDGTYQYDATIKYWVAGAWPRFGVLLPLRDTDALTSATLALLRGIIAVWKNARSLLMELAFSASDADDAFPASADDPMSIDLETYHRYDGTYEFDGVIDYSGADTVVLAGTV